MRLAWFSPTPSPRPAALDPLPPLLAALEPAHQIDRIDQRRAHDVVWQHHRAPYDLFVYELADTPAHAFIWPYLLHFPGVLSLHGPTLHESRALTLHATRRSPSYDAERRYSGWDLLQAPLAASRLTVASHPVTTLTLQRDYPSLAIRHVPPGLGSGPPPGRHDTSPVLRVGAPAAAAANLVRRAGDRLRGTSTRIDVLDGEPDAVLAHADVVVAVEWPGGEWPMAALAAMARGAVPIVLETAATADWPTLDPQSWQPRALTGAEPAIAISLDARDDEHSLVLALRRLAADRQLCGSIATAGHAWWRRHATLEQAVDGWSAVLAEAARRPPAPRPPDWPAHLAADGTSRARDILDEMGVAIDLFARS